MTSNTAADRPERRWDSSLYEGAAEHYLRGRMPYPEALFVAIAREVGASRATRVLDVGCGPGSLTLGLTAHVGTTVGVDADAAMVAVADREARARGVANVSFRCLRAEDLPSDLGSFDVVTLAQSFHWMERAPVAATLHRMLTSSGMLVHVHTQTHHGVDTEAELPHPAPPHEAVKALVARYVGAQVRAGRGVRALGPGGDEEQVYGAVGFRLVSGDVVAGRLHERTLDEVVSAVFSLSSSAPHLFGAQLDDFESDLRALLLAASPEGIFSEWSQDLRFDVFAA